MVNNMELFKLMGEIAIDTKDANSAIDSTTKKAKEGESEQSKAFKAIGSTAKTIATGIGTAGLAIGGAFIGAVEGTREYRVEMGKLDTAFVTNGHSSEVAKRTYSDLNAVLGDSGQAVEASNHLAVLTDNEKDLQTWTDICTGVYATFGDSLPIEGLTEASNETAKTGILTGGLVDALNWAGISEDEFQAKLDKCSNEQERQNLIMNTLDKTYKDASTQYKETNKDVIASEKAQEKLNDAMAKVGAEAEPIMTAIKMAIAGMAEKAVPVIQSVIDKVKDMAKWFKDNEEKVKLWGGVILIATATVAGFVLVMSWSSIMTKASNALKLVTVAVKALNVAMKANVIGLVVTAIIGLVATFIYLWKNCDAFRNFWIELWKKIVEIAKWAWKGIKEAFSAIGKWFKNKFNEVQKSGQDAMKKVKKFFSDAWTGIKNLWKGAGAWFKGIWTGIKNAFSSVGSWFKQKFQSAWTGIKNIWNNAKSFFSTVKTWVTTPFSSAKTFVVETFQKIYSSIKDKINSARDVVKKAVDKIKGFFKFKWELPKLKVPSFTIKGKFSLKDMTVPKIGLKWNAEGGIIDNPTIFGQLSDGTLLGGGEAGKEAILPLERNTEWMDRLAERLQPSNDYSEIISRINVVIDMLQQILGIDMNIYLDSGALVGELSPAIDRELGKLTIKKNRRNL